MENLVLEKRSAMATSKIWTYGDMSAPFGADVGPGVDLTGYGIAALDVRSRPGKTRGSAPLLPAS
jgi:hypothetical protein